MSRKLLTSDSRLIPPKRAVEILAKLIDEAEGLEAEPFASPKRSQWTETAQGVLERSFAAGSSILSGFGAAQSIAFTIHDNDEVLRQNANKTLASMVAVLQSGVEQLGWEADKDQPSEATKQVTAVPVFISHSNEDAALAEALIELLKSALGLVPSQIRCSSVDGYRLPVGVNTESKLREEVNAARVVVGLITPSSLASCFVMFELGARWGANLFLAPLLAGVKPGEMSGPLALLNALSASSEAQLHQLLEDVARALDLRLQNTASYLRYIGHVKQLADAIPTGIAVETASSAVSESKPKPDEIEKDLEYINDGGFYIRKSEKAEGKSIVYCPTCWGKDKHLIPLNPGTGNGYFSCDIHKSNHQTERYRVWLRQQNSSARRRPFSGGY